MKKIIFLVLMLLAYSASANADLVVEPSSVDAVVFQNQETKLEITLTNTNNFTIFNVSFTPNQYITYPSIDRMEIGESIKKNVSVLSNTLFAKTFFASTIKYNFLADVVLPSVNYNVTLTRDQSNLPIVAPSQVFLIIGDSVTWINNDSIPLTVFNPAFTKSMNPNQTSSQQFSTEGTFDYTVLEFSPLSGRVNVSKRQQQMVNNANLNKNLIIGIESKPVGSTVSAEVLPKQFTVRHNQESEGIFRLTAGNETAINIRMSADTSWITFEDGGFNMTPQQSRFIKFKIRPILVNITESNKTYTFTLKMEGDNTNSFSDAISVDIPFEDTLSLVNESDIEDCLIENTACWLARKSFCDAHQFSPACNPAPRKEIVEVIKYQDALVPHNFTPQEIASIITNIAEIKDDRRKTDQFINQKADATDTSISNINSVIERLTMIINQSVTLSDENRARVDNLTFSVLSTIFLILSLIIIAGVFMTMKKLKQRKQPVSLYYPQK